MNKIQQFNIMSFNYDRFKNSNFNLNVELFEAERNDELIAIADNECLRAVRRITGHKFNADGDLLLAKLFEVRKRLVRKKNSEINRRKIAELNNQIRELLFVPEIISVTISNKNDYRAIGKDGFKVNGRHYRRLLCSAAMARTNRVWFCDDGIYERLDEVLRCGVKSIKIVPAKWNAYYSLLSSATYQVTSPRFCVVEDYEIEMEKEVDWVCEDKHQDIINREVRNLGFNIWDGMGLISPKFAKKWSDEIGYDGIAESFIIRAPFIKGLVATFDFHKFANEVAKNDKILDIYGDEHNCNDVDIILTKSQFKLWNGYNSISEYEQFMNKYEICWGITRIGCPDDKNVMRTNYQFLQVLNMSDDDIKELCQPTIEWFRGVSGGNFEYKLLYLLGKIANSCDPNDIWNRVQDNTIKALMLEPELINDSHISKRIVESLSKRIQETYIGKLNIDGSFNFIYCDPYGLCEYIFGLEPKGLLKEFEFYAYFWSILGAENIVAMRSPLTWRAEVNKLNLKFTDEMQEWYKYIPNGVILNMWGNDRDIFSGCDFDGDILATTHNDIFLRCRYGGVPVMYKSEKPDKEIIEK